MDLLLALRPGQLVARLVGAGKWTALASTKRHLVRLNTDEARQRACPGDGTLIIRPYFSLSEKRRMAISFLQLGIPAHRWATLLLLELSKSTWTTASFGSEATT